MASLIHSAEIGAESFPAGKGLPEAQRSGKFRHVLDVLRQRLEGLPRTAAELNYSLQMLSVMRKLGWQESVRARKPVARDGAAIPWYTYPALEWLAPRVRREDSVFEYGAGNSTLWFSERVRRVVSVEHDPRWREEVRAKAGENVALLSRRAFSKEAAGDSVSPYVAALEEFPPESFEIIVIDGVERVACACAASSRIKAEGIIIFDDTHRPSYKPGIKHLHDRGFSRIDFYGLVSQVGTRSCTSIFSRFSTRWTSENVPLLYQGW